MRPRQRKRPALLDADADLPLPPSSRPAKARRGQPAAKAAAVSSASALEDVGIPDMPDEAGSDVDPLEDLEVPGSQSGSEVSKPDSTVEELMDYFERVDVSEGLPGPSDNPDHVEAGVRERLADGLGEGVPAPVPDPPPPADVARPKSSSARPVSTGPDALHQVRRMLASSRWGVFRITPKQPGSKGGGTYGGFEGTCCFHRKNDVTGCKKYVAIKGPDEADKDKAFRQVLFWCSQAKEVSRQSEHLKVPLDPVPLMPVLLAREITQLPEGDVKSDAQLDAEAAAAAMGRGKGKGRAARGPASKRAAKAAPKAAPRSLGDEAASDPSSSSSSDSDASSSDSSS